MEANIIKLHETEKSMDFRKKEIIKGYKTIVKKNGLDRTIVDVRFYMGRSTNSSVVYCSVWVHGFNFCGSGVGKAGGWGYHKGSAAMQSALDDAGIKLDKSIHGVGESAELEAIESIMTDMGHPRENYIIAEFYA